MSRHNSRDPHAHLSLCVSVFRSSVLGSEILEIFRTTFKRVRTRTDTIICTRCNNIIFLFKYLLMFDYLPFHTKRNVWLCTNHHLVWFVTTSGGCNTPTTSLARTMPTKAHEGPQQPRRPTQAHENGL